MKQLFLVALVCASVLGATKHGQTQDALPRGPIRLGGGQRSDPTGPVYHLLYLQVDGKKPTKYVWLLQRESNPSQGPVQHNTIGRPDSGRHYFYIPGPGQAPEATVEPSATVFRSLDSPVLRDFVSHLPAGTRILHSEIRIAGPDPTMKIDSGSEPGLQDFIKFCRSKGVAFGFTF